MDSQFNEFNLRLKQNNLDKRTASDLINVYMDRGSFIRILEYFKNKSFANEEFFGVVYSEEYEKDDDEYFGENKILFYIGNDEWDNTDDIVDYDEFYQYLEVACEFFLERNPSQKEKVEELMLEIKKTYRI